MTTLQRLLTAEEFAVLPDSDDRQCELIQGVVGVREAPPSSGHEWIQNKIGHLLYEFVAPRKLGMVAGGPGFVLERDPDTVRAPDVCFVRADRVPREDLPPFLDGAPDLAVEVRSPSNMKREMAEKIAQYLATGSRLVWYVDPERRTITVHRPGHDLEVLNMGDQLSGHDVLPGFQCPVADVFNPYWLTESSIPAEAAR
jgi:Uma2 family endonuclease